ncbi:MAG: NBR1-Ig-like domain-containing protein, partial [Anaerolineae bacterium]
DTPTDTPTATDTPTDTPTPVPACNPDSAFVTDVTVPDGTVFAPGARIDKVWRLRNTGDCTWDKGYQLVFIKGDLMGAPDAKSVFRTVPGDTTDIVVTMFAPEAPGQYISYWQMANDKGQRFGQRVTVNIVVQVAGQPVATPPVVATPPMEGTPIAMETLPPPPTLPAVYTPPPARLSGLIAYTEFNVSYPQHTYDVYIANPDGSNRRLLVHQARQPQFRADGRLIYNGDGGGKNDLFAINPDGSDERQVTNHPEDSHPTWSPMDGRFAFDSTQLKADVAGTRADMIFVQDDVYSRPPVNPRLILWGNYRMFGRYPLWLADDFIAFKGCNYWADGGKCGILKTPSWGDSQPIILTTDPSDIPTGTYGDKILFMSYYRNNNWEIYIMGIGGGEVRNLSNHLANDGLATFSPDGKKIAFVSDREGRWAIWAINPDGTGLQKLFDLEKGYGNEPGYEFLEERISWGPGGG